MKLSVLCFMAPKVMIMIKAVTRSIFTKMEPKASIRLSRESAYA
jgi:hypothetical protein